MLVRGYVVEAEAFGKSEPGQDTIDRADDLHLLPVSPSSM
jgi:hypothetical protein